MSSHSRGVQPFDASVEADAVRRVPQVVTPVVYPLRRRLVAQVLFQLVLGASVGPASETSLSHAQSFQLFLARVGRLTPAERRLGPGAASSVPGTT